VAFELRIYFFSIKWQYGDRQKNVTTHFLQTIYIYIFVILQQQIQSWSESSKLYSEKVDVAKFVNYIPWRKYHLNYKFTGVEWNVAGK